MQGDTKAQLSAIDCFSWETVSEATNKLVYYDAQGKRFERLVSKALMEKTLTLFDGKPHLVRRSSGGYSPAYPVEMLVYHSPGNTQNEAGIPPSIRVRVRMLDLERDSNNHVISEKLVVQYKVVPPTDLVSAPPNLVPSTQRYLMDFGHGIIPISVFDYYRDLRELVQACFVRTDELNSISKAARGSKVPLQTYRLPEPVLRIAIDKDVAVSHDYTQAIQNMKKLVQLHRELVPERLQAGIPLSVPTGSSPDVLLHYLRISKDPDTNHFRKPLLTVLEKPKEEDSLLLPFGVFERP